ncbi:hypothetical protein Bca52824_065034 [Brassica carinata]|uniref:glutamine synthetase n=1 Tax=Brassica carinata TaxID=52824 RepID=A0A8X7U9K8_BRACI|nr:hypothetical protein Bca52824_065034 [Brassica carinata]
MDIRSKGRTLPGPVSDPSKLPKWNYDGSSTNQAAGDDSEVILYPQAIFKDPFGKGNNILVMCDAYTPKGNPIPTNNRNKAVKIFDHPNVKAEEPWFGIEQEYTLLQKDVKWPLGWPLGGFPGPQGPYYCAVGADKAFGRDVVDAHYKACLYAGLSIGANGELMPGQWEFQISPTVGIGAGDQLWVARYILELNKPPIYCFFALTSMITEICGVIVSFDPKPIEGDWNGAAAHTNFSTKWMRKEGGLDLIKKAIGKLEVCINNTLQLMVKATRGVSPRTMKPQTSTNYLGYEIKLIGDWNGAAAHTNFSTKWMRKEGGLDLIKKAIGKLEVCINNTLQLMVKATRGVSPRTMKPQTSTNYLGVGSGGSWSISESGKGYGEGRKRGMY